MNNDTIGVDISKDHLDAYRLADGASRRFANNNTGAKRSCDGSPKSRRSVSSSSRLAPIIARSNA